MPGLVAVPLFFVLILLILVQRAEIRLLRKDLKKFRARVSKEAIEEAEERGAAWMSAVYSTRASGADPIPCAFDRALAKDACQAARLQDQKG